MDPKLFGRGSWYFIFNILFYFNLRFRNIQLLINDIKRENFPTSDFKKRLFNLFPHNSSLSSINYILQTSIQELNEECEIDNLELLKKRLMQIINGLPCANCRKHSLKAMEDNSIMSSSSFLYIFHFFIELRNKFYKKKIDRTMFDTTVDLEKNHGYLLYTLVKDND